MKKYLNFLIVLLSVNFFGCKTEKLEESLAYNFADVFVNYKQPAITPSSVKLSELTLARVNESKSNKEALDAISNDLALTTGMEKSVSNLQNSLKANIFTELETSFTLSQIEAIGKGQPLSSGVKKNIDLLLNSGFIDGFRSEIVMPTLDGKATENFIIYKSEYVQTLGASNSKPPKEPKDKCNESANDAFNVNKQKVDLDKVNAEKFTLNSFDESVVATNNQYVAAKIATKIRFNDARTKAVNDFTIIKAKFNNNSRLSSVQKNAVLAIQIALLNDQISNLLLAEKAQENADNLKKDADISNASKARDTDLEKISVKYNIELEKLEVLRRVAGNNCHNQGGGKK